MYVITTITLEVNGCEEEYEIGADVECEDRYSHEVGEPEISAPNCTLKGSRLVDDRTLPIGWSEVAEEALVSAYVSHCEDMSDLFADYDPLEEYY